MKKISINVGILFLVSAMWFSVASAATLGDAFYQAVNGYKQLLKDSCVTTRSNSPHQSKSDAQVVAEFIEVLDKSFKFEIIKDALNYIEANDDCVFKSPQERACLEGLKFFVYMNLKKMADIFEVNSQAASISLFEYRDKAAVKLFAKCETLQNCRHVIKTILRLFNFCEASACNLEKIKSNYEQIRASDRPSYMFD